MQSCTKFTNIGWIYIFSTIFRSLILTYKSLQYGVRSSPALFLFYFFSIFTGAITLRSVVQRIDNPNFDPDATNRLIYFFGTQYGLHVLLFLLNCFADSEPKKYDERVKTLKNPCPQMRASYLSKLSIRPL